MPVKYIEQNVQDPSTNGSKGSTTEVILLPQNKQTSRVFADLTHEEAIS
jgi:hypothetical protein